jgi:hypothetical protein
MVNSLIIKQNFNTLCKTINLTNLINLPLRIFYFFCDKIEIIPAVKCPQATIKTGCNYQKILRCTFETVFQCQVIRVALEYPDDATLKYNAHQFGFLGLQVSPTHQLLR